MVSVNPANQYPYEYDKETRTLKIDFLNSIYGASIEDFEVCMAVVIDKLIEIKDANTVILSQTRDFVYDKEQVDYLREIARLIEFLLKEKRIISPRNVALNKCKNVAPSRLGFLQKLIITDTRRDPVGAYVTLIREIRHLEAKRKAATQDEIDCIDHYLVNALLPIKKAFEKTRMIKYAQNKLIGYHVGNRDIYREIFHPIIRPNFMLTKYQTLPPQNAQMVDRYTIEDTEIQIYRKEDSALYHYHILPPEFTLTETQYTILDIARQYMAEHKPTTVDFAQPERMRELFYNIGFDLVTDIAENMKITLTRKETDTLAKILTRYTAGYGILEILLADENVQDFYINAPVGTNPIFLFHGKYEECVTNIIPTREDAEAWATRFRIESGRPLDEANPVLDTEMIVKGGRARVAAITRSLSPDGLAFAFRRHRDKPWTYPLFIYHNMLSPLAAGLMSFIIDGARTILFAGTRSAGKTSLLGSTISEIMKRYRIITVEDTLELPISEFLKMGFNIERMKARSILTHVETEVSSEEAIRTSLRLGDSSLIIGEVRSKEARALYESMRIGALANVVAGTIHGDSPYGVFDRVVNDLEVPPTSFKATDIIVLANRLRSADGLHTFRRVIGITEVRKDWTHDPQKEGAFVNLMEYNSKKDVLEPTDTFLNGESFILNEIGKRVREWHNDWEAIWDNIQLRAKIKNTIVDYAKKTGNLDLLEAETTVKANDMFHSISGFVAEEYGGLDTKIIYDKWHEWFKNYVKKVS